MQQRSLFQSIAAECQVDHIVLSV